MSKKRNHTAEHEARKLAKQAMSEIAERAFSRAFNEMCHLSDDGPPPRTVGDLKRWYLEAMRDCLDRHVAAS